MHCLLADRAVCDTHVFIITDTNDNYSISCPDTTVNTCQIDRNQINYMKIYDGCTWHFLKTSAQNNKEISHSKLKKLESWKLENCKDKEYMKREIYIIWTRENNKTHNPLWRGGKRNQTHHLNVPCDVHIILCGGENEKLRQIRILNTWISTK